MASKTQGIKSVPLSEQKVDSGVDRVVTKSATSGLLEADTVRSALLKVGDGRATIATQSDIDNAAARARQAQADREAGDQLWDPVKAYAMNAWDEFTFGAAPAAARGLARLYGGRDTEMQLVDEARRLREQNPISYHLGGLAGFAGQVVATEGMAASMRAAKAAQLKNLIQARRAAIAAGEGAKAATLSAEIGRTTELLEEAARLERTQGAAGKIAEDSAKVRGLAAETAALRETEADRVFAEALRTEEQAGVAADQAAKRASNAVMKELGPKLGSMERSAAAIAAGERAAEVPGILSGIERNIALGAAQGLHHEVTQATMGDKPFSFEDAVASTFAGAAIGGGTHIGASIAAKGASKAAAAFSQREAERGVARALKEFGVTGREMEKINQRLGGPMGVAGELEKAGINIGQTSPTALFDELAKGRKVVGDARNRIMDAASAAGAGEHVNTAELMEVAQQRLAGPRIVNGREVPIGSFERQRDAELVLKYFRNTMESLEATKPEQRLAKLDAIQSDLGKLAEKATPMGESVPSLKTELYRDLKTVVRHEMRKSVERAGSSGPQFAAQYDAVNRTYATLRTFDRMARRGLKLANTEAAGLASGAGAGGTIAEALASTAIFGAPVSLLYNRGAGSLFKALGNAAGTIRKGAAGVAGAMTATAAAQRSFERAITTVGSRGASKVGVAVLSPNMSKFIDASKFQKLVDKVSSGAVGSDLVNQLSKVSPGYEQEAAGWNARLAENVNSMLPKPSPYPVGYGRDVYKPAKGVLIDPDQMKVLRYLDAVANPLEVPMKVIAGVAGPEHVKALADMYPGLMQHMKDGLMRGLLDGSFESTLIQFPEVRAAVSNFAGMPVSASNSPEFAASVAEQRQIQQQREKEAKQNGPPPRGSGAAGSNAQRYGTESERISK